MKRSPFTVVYEACVLYPAPLRDLLMPLALTGVYRARWFLREMGRAPGDEQRVTKR
jgi:hypothetical protein